MEEKINLNSFLRDYDAWKNNNLHGRFIIYDHIKPQLDSLPEKFLVEEIGSSFLNVPIHSVTFGSGPTKILGWSQMHGNESTTTKAVFDLFNYFEKEPATKELLENCTIKIIPMLNPDGAARYTRENVNKVDLNRDARELKEKESRVLRECFNAFEPDFCFNLHDQRTIFGAGNSEKPATLSFLAPAKDEERSIDDVRSNAMKLIAAINSDVEEFLPGQTGRYDDAYNINCTGDSFQSLDVPTILFEAGHYKDDYLREETRKYMAFAILSGIQHIYSGDYSAFDISDYFSIPENQKNFNDVVLRNVLINGEILDVALQFQEQIKAGAINFEPKVVLMESNLQVFAHREIDCEGQEVFTLFDKAVKENDVVDQILLNKKKMSIKT